MMYRRMTRTNTAAASAFFAGASFDCAAFAMNMLMGTMLLVSIFSVLAWRLPLLEVILPVLGILLVALVILRGPFFLTPKEMPPVL